MLKAYKLMRLLNLQTTKFKITMTTTEIDISKYIEQTQANGKFENEKPLTHIYGNDHLMVIMVIF